MRRLSRTFAAAAVGLFGSLALYSTQSLGGYPAAYTVRQLCYLAAGVILFYLAARIPFRNWRKAGILTGGIFAFLLLLVLICGTRINGMRGWFVLFGKVSLQPSELAKGPFVLLLTATAFLKDRSEGKLFRLILLETLVFCGLVILEPDFGSASIFFAGTLLVMTGAGFRFRYILGVAGTALLSLICFLIRHPYALNRFLGLWDPEACPETAGWHVLQFRYTLANGGFFGADDVSALWSARYLPLAHSDSAFAAIAEASGMAGGLLILGGFLLAAWIFRKMAFRADTPEKKVFIFAAGYLPVVQAVIHVGVNTALIPVTGITLPFFSCGGSSLISVLLILGMISSASEPEPEFSESRDGFPRK